MSTPPISSDTLEFGSLKLYGAKVEKKGNTSQISYNVIETTPPEKNVSYKVPFNVNVNLQPSNIEGNNRKGTARTRREFIPPSRAEITSTLDEMEKTDEVISQMRKQKGLPPRKEQPGQNLNGITYVRNPQTKEWMPI